ncbi:Cell division control protein 24 OB domain 2 [Arabidopsis thaliana x Arabidopsis arenosa]|uniref:Cell division control protein 24 OB domain 2 n=1 Tax=Arabidopsis thaliana x Arabidopsis arenosa TaxID=1240361 RepID=A0A8T2EMW7_9BRAS|nr:Cell division control protein 24 OB domain 2 [Arabidopsis thaliana x Arabidopsis arenosa]
MGDTNGASLIEIGDQEEVEDPFLAFLDYARTVISPEDDEDEKEESKRGPGEAMTEASGPGWGWVASRILKTCTAYSSGVTAAILLSDLSQAWHEQNKPGMSKKKPELIDQLKKGHRRRRLANTVTIDSIYEKNFLSMNSVLEAVIINADVLPGTNIFMLTLGDFWSSNTIDLYLHRRYYELVETPNGILRKGREVLITGCYLRTAREGFGTPRLLPTEYLVVLLDEDQDDDAILIAAQFCSDTFSSVSLDAFNDGASYSLYARIESIGPLESELTFSTARRRQISLVDGDGDRLKFILWGEQVIVANLLSVGSVLGIERPYISSLEESAMEGNYEFCLEYGSATHLYLVPSTLQEERVCVALSQHQCQGSKLLGSVGVSQVTLPRDADGSVDFSNYPFRTMITDIRDKTTGISLYGVVTDISCDPNATGVVFSLKIEDTTGAIWAKLHFTNYWSLGRLGLGHVVYVSGLSCKITKENCIEMLWHEKDEKATFVNLSCLPAFLTSSCIHLISTLSQISKQRKPAINICRVKLDEIDQCHNINTRLAHSLCGHFIDEESSSSYGANLHCSFCRVSCNSNTEVVRTFHITITLADEETKLYSWCTGQSASAILQISPDEFCDLPEDDQLMYPSSLENEWFLVILANSGSRNLGSGHETDDTCWEITRALKI